MDQYPKARIEHGRAGVDILNRYYWKHNTFAGAMVYIKPNGDKEPAGVDSPSDDGNVPWESWETVMMERV